MRNEEHALFTYMYMYYIDKSNGHLRQNVVIHIIDQELRLLMNYTVTGKGCFFSVWYWDITTYGKLKQWRQPANETSHVHKKKNIKPKVSHTSFFISKDKTKSSKFSITHFNKNANWLKGEITVNSHWARFSALDVRQTFRSLFQSVVKLRFRSIPGIYVWKKQL